MPGKNSTRNDPGPGRVWNLDDIQELLDLLAVKEITEFEIEQQGVKIRVRRGNSQPVNAGNANGYAIASGSVPIVTAPPSAPVIPVVAAPPTPSPALAGPEAAADSTEGLFIIKSPIVGTFYSSPSPNAPPFVKVGDTVQVGQVICIIEAMKLMNELEAEQAGQVVRTYVENGQPVEYGQSLFAIEPARKK
ncbi:MAG TPA: acetyl-CoA carboxylase biotin carboxyl carrier protein [Terriglobia bacterium]|nr:acetyl-CoA carboxylase biotin carboxyl carrier protein [Terriglobia bacterium]